MNLFDCEHKWVSVAGAMASSDLDCRELCSKCGIYRDVYDDWINAGSTTLKKDLAGFAIPGAITCAVLLVLTYGFHDKLNFWSIVVIHSIVLFLYHIWEVAE